MIKTVESNDLNDTVNDTVKDAVNDAVNNLNEVTAQAQKLVQDTIAKVKPADK